MGQPIVHFEIASKDNERAMDFYSNLFGWKIDADNPFKYGMVDAADNSREHGVGIGGGLGAAMGEMPSYVTVYVEVDDVDASLAKAEGLGATRVMGPDEIMPGLTIGIFKDLEGQIIGVMHNVDE